jgi:hypothetical protein
MRADLRHAAHRMQLGQASVEFALVAAFLVAAMLLPWSGGLSPAEWLLGAIVAAARDYPAWLAIL